MKILGLHAFAWMWLEMIVAAKQSANNANEPNFYESKLLTAKFYFQKLLPQIESALITLKAGSASLMDFNEKHF